MAFSQRSRHRDSGDIKQLSNIEKQILAFLHDNYQSENTQHETLKIAQALGKKTKHEINRDLYSLKKKGYVEKVVESPPTWKLIKYEPNFANSHNSFHESLNPSSSNQPSRSTVFPPSTFNAGDSSSSAKRHTDYSPFVPDNFSNPKRPRDYALESRVPVSHNTQSFYDNFVIPPPPDVLLKDVESCFHNLSVEDNASKNDEIEENIMEIITNTNKITIDDIIQKIPNQNTNLIQQALSNLMRKNNIKKVGEFYSLPQTTTQESQTTVPKLTHDDELVQNIGKSFISDDFTSDIALDEASFPSSSFVSAPPVPLFLPVSAPVPILNIPEGKNAISLLNEFAQKNSQILEYTEAMSGPDHKRRFRMAVKLGNQNFFGPEAPTKKEAKLKAAEVALAALHSSVMNENGSTPGNPSSLVEATFNDKVAALVLQKYNELSQVLPDTIVGKKIIAGFVMTRKLKSGETAMQVVSIGSGNRCVKGDKLSLRGETVNDCHAEVIARRGLVRYLYRELINCDEDFKFVLKDDKYDLNPGIEFHLFINTAPCGDSAIFAPSDAATDQPGQDGSDGLHHPVFENNKQGLLRTKVENGEGCIPIERDTSVPTWDGILRGERLRTMSCSDKIAKWNFLGLQGSLLSHFLNPIYMSTLTLGMLYNHGHLTRAICCRVQKFMEQLEPDLSPPIPFTVHHPKVSGQNPDREIAKMKTREFSVNWSLGDERPEVLDGTTGKSEPRFGSVGISRICKAGLFQEFQKLCTKFDQQDMFKDGYYKSKMGAAEYQSAKQTLWYAFEKNGFGKWMPKPKEEKDF
ncbi:double-stranded RNA-specific adenosine deaminase-like isoform X1 [Styela clava]